MLITLLIILLLKLIFVLVFVLLFSLLFEILFVVLLLLKFNPFNKSLTLTFSSLLIDWLLFILLSYFSSLKT